MADEDDDIPQLSAETMKALQEFVSEQSEKEMKLREIVEVKDSHSIASVKFGEDWQLSQFWYNDETAIALAKVAIKVAGNSGRIALISCPTLYNHLKSIASNCEVILLEYDKRFAVYGDNFMFYDYKSPLDLPRDLANKFDIVIMDPPFLSDECLTKTTITASFLAKDKIVLCTGAVMEDLAKRLLNMRKCSFEPRHQNNLANEFCCYSNFNFDEVLSNVFL